MDLKLQAQIRYGEAHKKVCPRPCARTQRERLRTQLVRIEEESFTGRDATDTDLDWRRVAQLVHGDFEFFVINFITFIHVTEIEKDSWDIFI